MPEPRIAGRGEIAKRVRRRDLFALKVPKHEWVLIPIYTFSRNALVSGSVIGIVSVQSKTDWFEIGMVRSGKYNTELQEMTYDVVLVSRHRTLSRDGLRQIRIPAGRIGCIFNNDKSRLPVTTG